VVEKVVERVEVKVEVQDPKLVAEHAASQQKVQHLNAANQGLEAQVADLRRQLTDTEAAAAGNAAKLGADSAKD